LTFDNVTNTTFGINGLVLDVAGLVGTTLTASDIAFRISPTGNFDEAANPPSGWAAPAVDPSLIHVTAGSATTPARVRIEWPNNAIQNRWLQIRLLPTGNTGLPSQQTFYLGHLQGKVLPTAAANGALQVGNGDLVNVRNRLGTNVGVTDRFDITKNGQVSNPDLVQTRNGIGIRSLRLITIPVEGSGSEGSGNGGGAGNGLPQGSAPLIGEPPVTPTFPKVDGSQAVLNDGLNTDAGAGLLILPNNSGDPRSPSLGSSDAKTGAEKSEFDKSKGLVDSLFAGLAKEDLTNFFS